VGGSGADKYASVFTGAVPGVRLVSPNAPLAEAAARLAALRQEEGGAPHALRPIYLRRPDAEVARDRARQATPPAFRVRRADLNADLQAVEALQRQTFTNPWGADAIRWELENSDVARLYVLEGPSGALVAYCACWMIFDELHINSLAVDHAWRRHGAARTLLAHVLKDAARAGAKGATLEVRRSNEPACALYRGLGFSVGGVRRDYYQDPREDALILWNRRLESFASQAR
jgi:ribosomal-protein-alanine N-acetyltransferase